MSATDPLDFRPDGATLDAVLAEFEEAGASGGGAIDAAERRAALAAFELRQNEPHTYPPRWRHDYAALTFDDVVWSTGRLRVPARPRFDRSARESDDGAGRAALAEANAGGIVHAGSTYLEPADGDGGDPRVVLRSLADARRAGRESVDGLRGRIVAPDADRFTALATAFQNCGAFIEIPAGVALEDPLQCVWTAQPGAPSAVFPLTVVRVGAGARATIVERHAGSVESFVCGIVEIDLEPGAELDYVSIQQTDESARSFFRRVARCAGNARIRWHAAEFGATLSRPFFGARLGARRANAQTNALFFAGGFSHVDLSVEIDHGAPETTSDGVIRRAAIDRGQGRVAGSIAIGPGADRAAATMRDDALVLSRDAYLDAHPSLQIEANEASVYHAASVGSLDEERLFYVQSRGIARTAAARMIALAFFEAAIERFPGAELRDEVRTALDARLDEVPDTFAS